MRMSQRQVAAVANLERNHGSAPTRFVGECIRAGMEHLTTLYEDDIVVELPNGDVRVLNSQGIDIGSLA